MHDAALLLEILKGPYKKHRYKEKITIDEVTESIVCVDCNKTLVSRFIEGDEDRPDRWTGWGKCLGGQNDTR